MRTLRLLTSTPLADLIQAAKEAPEFAEWISQQGGVDVSIWDTFLALAFVRPWGSDFEDRYGFASPWRVVASVI